MTAATDREVVVIGGGPAGLAAAVALAARGADVELLEACEDAGGHVRAEIRDGFTFARGPQSFPGASANVWWMAERALLAGRETGASGAGTRFVYLDGRPVALPSSARAFLASPFLSLRGKARLVSEALRPRGGGGDESVRAFFDRRIGREATSALVAPFVSGVYAGEPDALEARSAFPRLVEWERDSGSLVRGALAARRRARAGPARSGLWSLAGGLASLTRATAAVLGPRVTTSAPVRALVRDGSSWRVLTDGSERRARAVVLATPADAASRLLRGPSPAAADLAAAVPLAPVAVVHLGGRIRAKPPEGYGILVPREAGLRTLGVVFSSSQFPDLAPPGCWLLTAYLGGTMDPGAVDLDDARLREIAAGDVSRLIGFEADAATIAIVRHRAAIPQFVRGHADRVAAARREASRLGGLALAGNWLDAVGLDGAIASGRRAASELAA